MKKSIRRCSGIDVHKNDVHKNSVTVCVLAPAGQPGMSMKKRKFRTFTRDLKQMRGWLKNCKVTEIAMRLRTQAWNRRGNTGGRFGTCSKASFKSCSW